MYSNVIIDEASMISNEQLNVSLKKLPKSKNIYVIQGTKQLPPVQGTPIKITKDFNNIVLSTVHRTNEIQYLERQNKALETNDINEKINIFQDRIISYEELLTKYRFNTLDVILCSKLDNKKYYNDIFFKIAKKNKFKIPISYNHTNSEHAKNSRTLINISEFNSKSMSLSFASTVHVVQGKTVNYNIFLSTKKLWCPELFNVAMSRNKQQANFYIVDENNLYEEDYESDSEYDINDYIDMMDDI
jgi:ATP-dependent exoDNAse (exonuclease V) alpha subunit